MGDVRVADAERGVQPTDRSQVGDAELAGALGDAHARAHCERHAFQRLAGEREAIDDSHGVVEQPAFEQRPA